MKKIKPVLLSLCLASAFFSASSPAFAKDNILSLSNLERERSALLTDMLDPSLAFDERLAKIQKRQRQLTDMERMVIRDERLLSSQNSQVKRAFNDYELTFLVHAGAEKNLSASSQWLEQVNFSSSTVLNASAGYR
ncbi:hypothetical protein ACFO4O_05570 [Glaciecola siphonariae]|uniref:Uncharacterized protein n=1 Tax=Glaciecola siphonariae TaxID=521012 RepID=A0ABV9LVE5_9ALTE